MVDLSLYASSVCWARISSTTSIIMQIPRQAHMSQFEASVVLEILISSSSLLDFWHVVT